jgi:hypothetical protein
MRACRGFRVRLIAIRHTYATLRLEEGVDVYLLAEQMGTSVHMIESHYGYVDIVKQSKFPDKGLDFPDLR